MTVVGYAPGAYDLFHIGHLNILRRARLNCDYLVAGVVNDEVAIAMKGRRPAVPEAERLAIVAGLDVVDAVFLEQTPDKLATWQTVRFDLIFKGNDWKGTAKGSRLEEMFARVGVQVVYLPYTEHTSTTQLRMLLGE